MPRQVLQNVICNPRTHNCEYIINNMRQAHVFHIDNLINFYDQLKYIKSSKIIIVADSSAFLFNGLFVCKRFNNYSIR